MASTNKTTNYELSQFQSSDIPAWLTDYNGDMQKIDAGIHAAKVQAEGAANGVSALQTAVSGKQDRLTFDDAPTQNSSNPVKSGGVYAALQNVSVQTDAVPTAGSTNAVQSGGVYSALQGKQNSLTFDNTPTQNSQNPVTSGGVYAALQNAGGKHLIAVIPYTGSNISVSARQVFSVDAPFAIYPAGKYRLTLHIYGANRASGTGSAFYILARNSGTSVGQSEGLDIAPTQAPDSTATTPQYRKEVYTFNGQNPVLQIQSGHSYGSAASENISLSGLINGNGFITSAFVGAVGYANQIRLTWAGQAGSTYGVYIELEEID